MSEGRGYGLGVGARPDTSKPEVCGACDMPIVPGECHVTMLPLKGCWRQITRARIVNERPVGTVEFKRPWE